jgi:hypothetical protein
LNSIIAGGQLALLGDGGIEAGADRLTESGCCSPPGLAKVAAQPPTPRTELVLELLWSNHQLGRRTYLRQMNESLEQTITVSAMLQAASVDWVLAVLAL